MDYAREMAGKRVVITGACGIIGGWLAETFGAAGARLCLTDARASELAALERQPWFTEGSFTKTADLRDAASIEALAAEVGARWGAADVLINNAGVYPSGFLLDIDAEEWDRIFDINLRAPFLTSRAFARQMIAQGVRGNIINISSGAARKMRRTVCPYSTSKTALDRLTKGFALELAEYGIRANALEPGFAPGSVVSPLSQDHVDNIGGGNPSGRTTSKQDVGNAALFLASSAAVYITGASLPVDGGGSIGSLAVYQDKKHAL
ncbi:SDR family NAD(P)-dependent oxidoreductase [Roseomonas marmotae]|uniref:SDR family oxidoreductase n=1 Tax=Roseomonas marmotae TaxID=2768161 RepID=A0ABS3KF56_9PROT|nr:SDR family oxidoreductase [Roseomonas marmotae]MBO1076105.1 SDR family oxidoreductase [Roseomonas marmotae]QTI81341.1 SDR family oxidoreductase [Roseomonas marmotae]